MTLRTLVVAALLAGLPTGADAEQYWTKTRITGVGVVGTDSRYPQYSDMMWIGVADDRWLPAHCRKSPGLLASVGQHGLLLLAMRAADAGKPVTIKADDKPMIGDYCRLFQIHSDSGD